MMHLNVAVYFQFRIAGSCLSQDRQRVAHYLPLFIIKTLLNIHKLVVHVISCSGSKFTKTMSYKGNYLKNIILNPKVRLWNV